MNVNARVSVKVTEKVLEACRYVGLLGEGVIGSRDGSKGGECEWGDDREDKGESNGGETV